MSKNQLEKNMLEEIVKANIQTLNTANVPELGQVDQVLIAPDPGHQL